MDKDSEIKVSVLITFYNQEKYVNRAIQSVIDQNVKFDYEILIGNDGSTDNTLFYVQQWKEQFPEKIKIINRSYSERHIIPRFSGSQNRINLLSYLNGKYFIFLDGDDYFCDKNKLQKQVDILYNEDKKDCSHANKVCYMNGRVEINDNGGLSNQKIDLKTYWKNYYFHPDTCMIRSSIISKLPLDYLKYNFHDNLIMLSVLNYGKLYYLSDCMTVYSNDGAGLWTGSSNIFNMLVAVMNYDMYCYLAPKCRNLTTKRFSCYWLGIISERKNINRSDYYYLEDEAKRLKLNNLNKWLKYNELNVWERMKVFVIAYSKAWRLDIKNKVGRFLHLRKNK